MLVLPTYRVIAALLIGIVAGALVRPVAAQQATPVPETAFRVTVDASLLAVPGGTARLAHAVDQPGRRFVRPAGDAGLVAVSVVAGVFTIASDGPIAVIAEGATTVTAMGAGRETAVGAGETVFFRGDARTEQRNDGAVPTERYVLTVAAAEVSGAGIVDRTWALDDADWQPPASGPVTVTLRSGRGPTPPSGPNLLAADTGEGWLTVAFEPGSASGAPLDLAMAGADGTPIASPAAGG